MADPLVSPTSEARIRAAARPASVAALSLPLATPELAMRLRTGLADYGAMVITDCYGTDELAMMRDLLIGIEGRARRDDPSYIWQGEALWAIWNLFEKSAPLMRLCLTPRPFSALARAQGEPLSFIRATVMKKEPGAGQQSIGWHQDLATAVDRELGDAASVGIRAGVPHRDVSATLYGRMVNVRINVEAQYADGGCLKIIPGTHRLGKENPKEVRALADQLPVLLCPIPAGSLLVYLPLLFHSSGPNTRQVASEHRRVIHTEFRPLHSVPGADCGWFPWRHGADLFEDQVSFHEQAAGP